ncbi:MAG: hypothetical protein MHPSP_003103, partial [Paramarteilia canceri]
EKVNKSRIDYEGLLDLAEIKEKFDINQLNSIYNDATINSIIYSNNKSCEPNNSNIPTSIVEKSISIDELFNLEDLNGKSIVISGISPNIFAFGLFLAEYSNSKCYIHVDKQMENKFDSDIYTAFVDYLKEKSVVVVDKYSPTDPEIERIDYFIQYPTFKVDLDLNGLENNNSELSKLLK